MDLNTISETITPHQWRYSMSKLRFNKNEVLKMLLTVKPESKVTLVGDSGIYLMCFDQPTPRTIVYAKGCNPDKDADYYENKTALYGGDDGGDDICDAGDLKFAASSAASTIIISLTSTHISVGYDCVAKPKQQPDFSVLPAALKHKLGIK